MHACLSPHVLSCLCSSCPFLVPVTLYRSYEAQAMDVLEATKDTATDPEKQFAISFFDNKFASLIPLKVVYVLE